MGEIPQLDVEDGAEIVLFITEYNFVLNTKGVGIKGVGRHNY